MTNFLKANDDLGHQLVEEKVCKTVSQHFVQFLIMKLAHFSDLAGGVVVTLAMVGGAGLPLP